MTALLAGHSYGQGAYLRWYVLKEDVLVWYVTHQPFHARQQPVPSRLITTSAGTTPPSGAHGASHPQCRPGDLPAFQLWQVQQEGRVLFYPQVLGPRLWWRELRQGLAMCCTSGPVISSEFTPLYKQQVHTTVNSHHSMTSELTPLYDQQAHTTL